MKVIDKIHLHLNELEHNLAADVARLAELLMPYPHERDALQLETAWGAVISSRRKLAFFLKDSLQRIRAADGGGGRGDRKVRATRKAVVAAQKTLRYWGRFEMLVTEQLQPSTRNLIGQNLTPKPEFGVVDHVVSMFVDAMHKLANPNAHLQSDDAIDRGYHSDIPLPMSQFAEMISAAYRLCLAQRKAGPLRFLDVGSGGGTKVLAASTCFDLCVGLEYEENIVRTGSAFLKLLAPETCRLIQGDALIFGGYGDYDVIYFFRPVADFDDAIALEEQVIAQVRPGTVLLVAGDMLTADHEAQGVHRLANNVYVTGMSGSEAETLYHRAREMGTMVPGYGRRPMPHLGYWRPLRDASARNGYHV